MYYIIRRKQNGEVSFKMAILIYQIEYTIGTTNSIERALRQPKKEKKIQLKEEHKILLQLKNKAAKNYYSIKLLCNTCLTQY